MAEAVPIVARHDYLPFGEEIAAGIGLRTSGQGFGGTDYNRLKYALTERDDVTNLDHAWFRKLDSLAGRFTSPDPARGVVDNPQSFNKYAYTNDDPVNLVDPTGLRPQMCGLFSMQEGNQYFVCFGDFNPFYGARPKGGGGGGAGSKTPPKKKKTLADKVKECAQRLFGVEMTKFEPSSPGNNGKFEGTGPDVLRNGGNDNFIRVTNDVQTYSGTQLGRMDTNPTGPVMGKTFNPKNQFTVMHGLTPFRNYTANELTNRTVVLATQIHELGNSLAHITGIWENMNGTVSPPTVGGDRDPGVAMERCVMGGDVDSAGNLHEAGH